MPASVPINKNTNSAETSDWECTNCGALTTGINNLELTITRTPPTYRCLCTGVLRATRNEPKYKAKDQKKNQGGGNSFPGG